MKKKNFTSKLQFQKTTVVSFNTMASLNGGALQNVDTQIISVDGLGTCEPSQIDTCVTTQANNTCPLPTAPTNTRTTENTNFCGGTIGETRQNCEASLLVC